jgi:hypothetical protein
MLAFVKYSSFKIGKLLPLLAMEPVQTAALEVNYLLCRIKTCRPSKHWKNALLVHPPLVSLCLLGSRTIGRFVLLLRNVAIFAQAITTHAAASFASLLDSCGSCPAKCRIIATRMMPFVNLSNCLSHNRNLILKMARATEIHCKNASTRNGCDVGTRFLSSSLQTNGGMFRVVCV